jgi:hypothetical protein
MAREVNSRFYEVLEGVSMVKRGVGCPKIGPRVNSLVELKNRKVEGGPA